MSEVVFRCVLSTFPTMPEALDCRSPSACAACPHSDRAGRCLLEAQVDLALEALAAPRRLLVAASPARARA